MKCSIDDCEREAKARGWCSEHYARWHRTGDANYPRQQAPRGSVWCYRGHRKEQRADGSLYCRECQSVARKKYYAKNAPRLNRKTEEYYDREENTRRQAEWREENGDKWREYLREYHKERLKDPQFATQHSIRSRLGHAYKSWLLTGNIPNGLKQRPKYGWGFDYEPIIQHLGEPDGEYGRGRGKFTIDHIIPLSEFRLLDKRDFLIAIHPLNHRLVKWEENHGRHFNSDARDRANMAIHRYYIEMLIDLRQSTTQRNNHKK